jgi:adenosine deaminase
MHTTEAKPQSILLCTLGISWAVIPEVYAWLAPRVCPLYEKFALDPLAFHPPEAIWIITTGGVNVEPIKEWWQALDKPTQLKIWIAADTQALATKEECALFQELTLRVAILARETVGTSGCLLFSLAGGRKTMSSDLQIAAELVGADALIHVVGTDPLPNELKNPTPTFMTQPLPEGLVGNIQPIILSSSSRSEILDIEENQTRISSEFFPIAEPESGEMLYWQQDGNSLVKSISKWRREAQQLLGNFIGTLNQKNRLSNWPSLIRLSLISQKQLLDRPLQANNLPLLRNAPKAELHCHIGGFLSLSAQRQVAQAIVEATTAAEKEKALQAIAPLLNNPHLWEWEWPELLKHELEHPEQRAVRAAMLMTHTNPLVLERQLTEATLPRVGLKTKHPQGFSAYERPGELTGSAQLTHPAALAPTARALVGYAKNDGIVYLELRGSPHKYRPQDPVGFLQDFCAALKEAGARTPDEDADYQDLSQPLIGFIWILDRRQRERIPEVINQAILARKVLGDFLLGIDLAGDEGTNQPEELAPHFTRVFEACIPVTIHAGEGEAAENIWQAAYHLHADRIGHGLTLADNQNLARRFRDRGILLELCPTSNREVVGFYDPAIADSWTFPPYPLAQFLEMGIPVTLCTDNPGIGQSTLSEEYLVASRMLTAQGEVLTLRSALSLIYQGFFYGFAPAHHREQLKRLADAKIFSLLSQASSFL